MRSPTAYKFRHYRLDESGQRKLIWASHGRDNSFTLRENELIIAGSDLDREVREAQNWGRNALADEGEIDILAVYFDIIAVRTNFYIGLAEATPGETSTLASISEAAGSGYAREVVARGSAWTAPTAAGGTTSDTVTFTATGTWTAVTDCFLTEVVSGTSGEFIAWSALSVSRTLVDTDTLDVDITVTLE